MIRLSLAVCLLLVPLGALAQARPTANRAADLQAGGGYASASSDYSDGRFTGGSIYAALDLTHHHGAEFDMHLVHSGIGDQVAEQTFELGYRFHLNYGRFKPYARAMYGRGRFNFGVTTGDVILAYNLFAFAGGTDFAVTPRINIRADYEFQQWRSGHDNGLVHGLNPTVFTIGAAYHFPSAIGRGRHY